jgi:hypothetical protein
MHDQSAADPLGTIPTSQLPAITGGFYMVTKPSSPSVTKPHAPSEISKPSAPPLIPIHIQAAPAPLPIHIQAAPAPLPIHIQAAPAPLPVNLHDAHR